MLLLASEDGIPRLVLWSFRGDALAQRVWDAFETTYFELKEAQAPPPLENWTAETRAAQLAEYAGSNRLRKVATAVLATQAAGVSSSPLLDAYKQVSMTPAPDPITNEGASVRLDRTKALHKALDIMESLGEDTSVPEASAKQVFDALKDTGEYDARRLIRINQAFTRLRHAKSESNLPKDISPKPTEFGEVSFSTEITHTLGTATGAVCLGKDLTLLGRPLIQLLENTARHIASMYNAEAMQAMKSFMQENHETRSSWVDGVKHDSDDFLNVDDRRVFRTFQFHLRRLVHTVDNFVLVALDAQPITMDDTHPAAGTNDIDGLLARPMGTVAPGDHPSPQQVHVDTDDDHVWLISIPLTAGSETALYDTTDFTTAKTRDSKPTAPSMNGSPVVERTLEMREHKCGGPTIFKGNFPHSTPAHAQTVQHGPSGERVEVEVYDNIMWLRGFRTREALTPEAAVEKLQKEARFWRNR